MDINFPLILVLVTFASGIIWLLDHFIWRPKRLLSGGATPTSTSTPTAVGGSVDGVSANSATSSEISQGYSISQSEIEEKIKENADTEEPWIVEMSRSFFPVLLVVLVLRSFLVEPFQIPSGSMLPTLEVGDFILVNKFAYGMRLPVLGTKIVDVGDPQRGDVFVFHHPGDGVNYIKRVIGLPGDHLRYKDKTLYINGKKISSKFVTNMDLDSQPSSRMFVENLGDVKHSIYTMPSQTHGKEGEWTIPQGQYFAMGDNRDNSNDSRYWGFVPDDRVVGKAFGIWMQWKSFGSLPSFSRVGAIQ